MVIDETGFEFGDFKSDDYNLQLAHLDTEYFTPAEGTLTSATIFNKRNHSRYLIGDDYSEYPVSTEIEILTKDGEPIDDEGGKIDPDYNVVVQKSDLTVAGKYPNGSVVVPSTNGQNVDWRSPSAPIEINSGHSLKIVSNLVSVDTGTDQDNPKQTSAIFANIFGRSEGGAYDYLLTRDYRTGKWQSRNDPWEIPLDINGFYKQKGEYPKYITLSLKPSGDNPAITSDSWQTGTFKIIDTEAEKPSTKVRKIERALFNKKQYKKIYFNEDVNYPDMIEGEDEEKKRLYFNCRLLNPQRIENGTGGVIGFKCTMECSSGLFMQDEMTKIFTPSNSATEWDIEVDVDTDTNDYVYPVVEVTPSSNAKNTITITNTTDSSNRVTTLHTTTNTPIVLNGEVNYISGSDVFPNYFVRLLPGMNTLHIKSTVSLSQVKLTWHNQRYI